MRDPRTVTLSERFKRHHHIVSDNNIKPVRVLHLVSSEGVTGAAQQALFMPMLTRMPKARVKMLVVALYPNVVQGAVLRQNGVPVYDVALSKRRFSLAAFGQLLKAVRSFHPDVIQAWGHTAQIVSHWLRGRCDWDVKVVWSVANTAPLPRKPGMIDRQKLKYAARRAPRADRIVYTSEAAASAHRRAGFPEDDYVVVPLGVDPTRFKPDLAMRRKVRERLGLEQSAFVIGMMAPFQPEYDHATLVKAVGELIKTNANVTLLLAGHGVQKGNAPLMALVGGGTLGTRTQLLGEWSDVAAFFNACDIACSSALTDNGRMALVMAMLCGIPCVATGMGAQGEVIGQHGVAVEPGSPPAFIRGLTRLLQLPNDKRIQMAQGARKHALTNFVSIRSLQKYLQLYYDLVGRKLEAATSVPVPKIDASIPAPAPVEKEPPAIATKPKSNRSVDMQELSDPDSLESRDSPASKAPTPKPGEGDVLQMFETALATQAPSHRSPMSERARGVAEELEDFLSPEMLQGGGGATAKPGAAPVDAQPPVEVAPPVVVRKAETIELTPDPTPAPSSMATTAKILAAPEPASPTVSEELAFAETTLDLAKKMQLEAERLKLEAEKVKLEATSSFEIPPGLIFQPVAAAKPTKASVAEPSAPTPAVASVIDTSALSLASDDAPKPAPGAVPSAEPVLSKVADSSTVPALAVDAMLSAAESSAACAQGPASDSLQLDLLGDAPSKRPTSAEPEAVQASLPLDLKLAAS